MSGQKHAFHHTLCFRVICGIVAGVAVGILFPETAQALKKGYKSVGLYNFAVANKDLPDNLIYAIVDAVFANHQELVQAHPAAAATVPANFVHNTFLPYHPGASRYYANRAMTGTIRGD